MKLWEVTIVTRKRRGQHENDKHVWLVVADTAEGAVEFLHLREIDDSFIDVYGAPEGISAEEVEDGAYRVRIRTGGGPRLRRQFLWAPKKEAGK